MKKADFILVAVVVGIAAAILLCTAPHMGIGSGQGPANVQTGTKVQITSGQEVIGTYPLSEPQTIPVRTQYGYNLVEITDGRVLVREADCKNQICVNSGAAGETGESIVCLPHKLVISVQ